MNVEINYEPKTGYHGQFSTDVLIELYFEDSQSGVCVEVGAANGMRGSNTLYFENKGWKALCIEPNPEYFEVMQNIRKECVLAACGSKNEILPFTVFDIGKNNIMSSVSGLKPDERLIVQHKDIINDRYIIDVSVRTLDDILSQQSYEKDIDFISIDTEGTELDALKGLDLNYWNVKLLVIENNFNDQEIEDYLNTFGYIKDARWKINDFYIKGEI